MPVAIFARPTCACWCGVGKIHYLEHKMGQFLFGLAAGVIVGLVMEWVIDWAGLLPARPAQRQTQAAARKDAGAGGASVSASSPLSNAEQIPHANNDIGRD